ncbi:hypothetical protein A2U01_0033597, partial [Trifolium medium]|nr:hypothetical protein [Trifolium medium]
TYNCDQQTLQAFLDEATVHGAFDHLTPVRWVEDAAHPDFGILADIHAHYVQTPQGQQAMAALNAYIPQNVDVHVAAQAEVPGQGAPPVEEPA